MFGTSNPSIGEDFSLLWEHSISNKENLSLCAVPTEKEVKDTLWAMHLLKAPGPDGMPGIFFTFYCSIVGPQVVRFVQDYFQNGVLLKAMNFTNLVLIPKSAGAATFANFVQSAYAMSLTR